VQFRLYASPSNAAEAFQEPLQIPRYTLSHEGRLVCLRFLTGTLSDLVLR